MLPGPALKGAPLATNGIFNPNRCVEKAPNDRSAASIEYSHNIQSDALFSVANDYGQFDGQIGILAPVLGREGLEHLKARINDLSSRPVPRPADKDRVRIGWGTRFTVRRLDGRTGLDVFEGAVEIRTGAGDVRRVGAGQAASFDSETFDAAGPADRAREAWSRGRIPADNLALGALLKELGRYRHGFISVAPEVAGLTVMGVFPADDPDLALSMLERSLPIRVRRTLPWWITVEAL